MISSIKNQVKKIIPRACMESWHEFRYPAMRPTKMSFGDKYVYPDEEGSGIIRKMLRGNQPCLIMRFGWNELSAVNYFIGNCNRRKIDFPSVIRRQMNQAAGFFPDENSGLARFASESIEIVKKADVLAVTVSRGDEMVVRKYCPDIKVIQTACIGDYVAFLKHPWTEVLEGKKVLVVHPFENSIRAQYEKRDLLFNGKKVLPAFTLLTFKPWQSAGDGASSVPFETWFDALDDMCGRIGEMDFDIALIGAGAYGMFLGAYCKSIGKKAVHMGGALQLLFGIKGRRWEKDYPPAFKERLFNRHWISPSEMERPPGAGKIEGACYW